MRGFLRQEAPSSRGAVGLMQLLQSTRAEMSVGDIHQADPNVHACAKYMRELIRRYFPDAPVRRAEPDAVRLGGRDHRIRRRRTGSANEGDSRPAQPRRWARERRLRIEASR